MVLLYIIQMALKKLNKSSKKVQDKIKSFKKRAKKFTKTRKNKRPLKRRMKGGMSNQVINFGSMTQASQLYKAMNFENIDSV